MPVVRTYEAALVYSDKLFHVRAAAIENMRSSRTDEQVNGISSIVASAVGSLPGMSVFQG